MGCSPPEVLFNPDVRCQQHQDVYSFGVLVLVVILRESYKAHNLWTRRVSYVVVVFSCLYCVDCVDTSLG